MVILMPFDEEPGCVGELCHTRVTCRFGAAGRLRFEGVTLEDDDG